MLLPVLYLLWTRSAMAVFFHENSSIVLAPHGESNISFGFSLGYQGGGNASLVIGAPLYDRTGRVFKRSVQDILNGHTTCEPLDIDFDHLNITYDRSLSPDQNFYLGASIAAMEEMFVTCAPLRTANYSQFGAYAACFAYNNSGSAHPCQQFGLDYLRIRKYPVPAFAYGSSGWSSMIDKDKNKIIISKSFNTADLSYSGLKLGGRYQSLYWRYPLEKTINGHTELTMTNFGKAMTFGNYFDKNTNKTYYAFSLRDMSGKGAIAFLRSDGTWKPLKRLEDKSVGSMFGAALSSVDVTRDGCADLLVGAPAQVSDTRSNDRGAVHVYAKSDGLKMELKLIIWGVTDGGRFGTTLSTNDVDGDSYPEIFVSAPFEKSGIGALYILCGHEIHNWKDKKILVTELRRAQRIEKESHKIFGFSLQPLSDFNDNGSDELGVGAPGNSRVILFSGVPAITVKVTSKFLETAFNPDFGSSSLIFSSCITVNLPTKPKIITTNYDDFASVKSCSKSMTLFELLVTNVINGKSTFNNSDEAIYEIDLATEEGKPIVGNVKEYCKNISIVDASVCIVNTTVTTLGNIQDFEVFNGTWVTLSAQSELTKLNHFECVCPIPTCAPELSAELRWSGGNNTDNVTYLIGSSHFENVKVVIRNSGTKGCSSCAVISVSGLDHQLQCQREGSDDPRYKCAFDSFIGNTTKVIQIQLITDKLSNQESNFTVDVEARRKCDELGPVTSLTVPYNFTKVLDNVMVSGTSMDREIADTEMDGSEKIIYYEQTYTIVNNQSFTWKNILVNLTAKNRPFIQNLRGAIKQTGKSVEHKYNSTDDFVWSYVLTLTPHSNTKMCISATILKKELANYLENGTITILSSEVVLELFPDKNKYKTLTTVLTFKKEKTFIHDKVLITIVALITALLLLIIGTVILYKLNFFARKNKQKLKQEIRRRSFRRESSRRQAPADADEPPSQPCETVTLMSITEEYNAPSDATPNDDATRSSLHEIITHAQCH